MRRYQDARIEEISNPGLWMSMQPVTEDPMMQDDIDNQRNKQALHFEDLSNTVEVSLLVVIKLYFEKMHGRGKMASWKYIWQRKQLLKNGAMQGNYGLTFRGLKSLNLDFFADLDEDIWRTIYEPRMDYRQDFGDLTRSLSQRYFGYHDFEGESLCRELWGVLRDLDFEAMEQPQVALDQQNDLTHLLLLEAHKLVKAQLQLWSIRLSWHWKTMMSIVPIRLSRSLIWYVIFMVLFAILAYLFVE